MKKLYLASSIESSAHKISQDIGPQTKNMTLVFINTAAESEEGDKQWLKNDRQAWKGTGFKITDYTFTGKKAFQIKEDLEKFDVIHINGGNSLYLMQQMRQTGADKIVKGMVEKGKIYVGSSAGSIVAGPNISFFKNIENRNAAPKLTNFIGLSLVNFVIFPHWGSDSFREYHANGIKKSYVTDQNFILLADDFYIKVEDGVFEIK